LSFNELVGERTEERGYKKANVIAGPKGYELGVGGGICQTASTVYAAALFAGLEIVERYHHRFRVKYMPPGLDATVNYGKKDLKVRNNLPFPVVFELGFVKEGELVARVMAPAKMYSVKYKYEVMEEVLSDRVQFEMKGKSKDLVKYYGRPGYKIARFRYLTDLVTGTKQREALPKDEYQASPWVLRVEEYPDGNKALAGLTPGQIEQLLQGSRYTVDMARFPDVKADHKDWVRPPSVRAGYLEGLTRFRTVVSTGDEPKAEPQNDGDLARAGFWL